MSHACADVLIHIRETLSDKDIHTIQADLSRLDGVYSACVSARARHLMLVDYDPAGIASGLLLKQVQGHGVHAGLVGL